MRGASRRWPAVVVGIVLMGPGTAAFVASSGLSERGASLVGGNLPVNGGALDRLQVGSHNSPAVVANPRDPANLAVASRIDSPEFSCALHVSFDGGASWAATPIPAIEGATVGCFAPDIAFGADGTLALSFTSFSKVEGVGTVPEAVWIASSKDGGRTLSTPWKASGPLAFGVRLAADQSRAGRLYATWIQASAATTWGFRSTGNPIVVSRSDDGGVTWEPTVTVTPPTRRRVVAPTIAMGDGENLYVAYLDVGDDRIDYEGAHEGNGGPPHPGPWSLVVTRSVDGGRTWTEAEVDSAVVPTQRFLVLFPPTPSLVVDRRRGAVYAAFHDQSSGDADVVVWASRDQGTSWSPGARVSDQPRPDGSSQYLPQLALAADGRLDVVYYDRRSDPEDVRNDVSLQSSYDEGRSFAPPLRLSERSFDSRIGFGSERNMPELGSRLGLLATNRGGLAVWADTRSNDPLTRKQDLARAIVSFTQPSPLAIPLRYGGLALALVGVAVLVRALFAGRAKGGDGRIPGYDRAGGSHYGAIVLGPRG